MEVQRKIFATFMSLHAHKASPTSEPMAHLQFYSEGAPLSPADPLLALTREDVLEALDAVHPDAELVRWLLEQMRTYDCTCQTIVGLVFDNHTVLSEVLRAPPK